MNTLLRILSLFGIAAGLTLAGCGDHDHDHGPDHDHEEHSDHDHDADPHDHDHEHADEFRTLGTVEIGGTKLQIGLSGDIAPNAELHLDVAHLSGPAPAAVRLWVGVESGEGSLRSKADAENGGFHGHVEAPAKIGADAALWIEVEDADGERTKGSLALK